MTRRHPDTADAPCSRRVGAVVIGRNEGTRLDRCLASLAPMAFPLVYVDSGSTDDSVATARAAGAEVVELDLSEPFTAARARNAGLSRILDHAEPPGFVQFVDGDCEVRDGWIACGLAAMEAEPDLAVVCGRRRERHPEASVWNLLCDCEWNTPVGEAAACGGDALVRVAALREVNGYDAALIAGEEPEMCLRLGRRGWRVRRLDAEMTLHDAAMTRFGQWWRRAVRGGWAIAEGAAMHGQGPERYNLRPLRSVLFWGLGVPGAIMLALTIGLAGQPAAFVPATLLALAYPAMILRIARRRCRDFGDDRRTALLYGAFTMLGKVAELQGIMRFVATRLSGRRQAIIEYKGPAA